MFKSIFEDKILFPHFSSNTLANINHCWLLLNPSIFTYNNALWLSPSNKKKPIDLTTSVQLEFAKDFYVCIADTHKEKDNLEAKKCASVFYLLSQDRALRCADPVIGDELNFCAKSSHLSLIFLKAFRKSRKNRKFDQNIGEI